MNKKSTKRKPLTQEQIDKRTISGLKLCSSEKLEIFSLGWASHMSLPMITKWLLGCEK